MASFLGAMDRRARIVDQLRRTISDLSEGKLNAAAVDPAAAIFDHGYVDSLSAVVLIEHVHDRYGVTVTETDLVGRLHTLDALGAFIASHGAMDR